MEKLRIALCGCWGHAEMFGELLNSYEESEVVAVWDNVDGRGERIAEHLGCVCERDYDRLVSDYGLDGVVIVAENALHKELILKAVRHKINIFVEKPLCVFVEDAKEIQAAVHEAGVIFYMTDLFVSAGTMKMKELISDGSLGSITAAMFHFGSASALKGFANYCKEQTYGAESLRDGRVNGNAPSQGSAAERPVHAKSLRDGRVCGGVMVDIGGHAIHQAHYLFGKPEKLSAVLSCLTEEGRKQKVEELAFVTMQYPDGKIVSLECSWVSGVQTNMQTVYGTAGSAMVTLGGDKMREEQLTMQTEAEGRIILEGDALPPSPTRHVRYWVEMMVRQIPNDMVGVDPSSNQGVSIDHAVEQVEIIDAIYRSAAASGAMQMV